MTALALLTENEAAARLRVCARTLRKARQAGHLQYIRIGRKVLYAPDDLDLFVERVRVVEAPRPKRAGAGASPNRTTGVIVPFSKRAGRRE